MLSLPQQAWLRLDYVSLLPIYQFQALKHPWLRLDNGLVAELKEAKVNTELMKRYTAR